MTETEYIDAVIEACNKTKYRTISPGLCGCCGECQSAFGEGEMELNEGYESGELNDEGGFSWQDCECCGSTLGGNRYAAHGLDANDDILHFDVCEDCLCYLANGDIPGHLDQ